MHSNERMNEWLAITPIIPLYPRISLTRLLLPRFRFAVLRCCAECPVGRCMPAGELSGLSDRVHRIPSLPTASSAPPFADPKPIASAAKGPVASAVLATADGPPSASASSSAGLSSQSPSPSPPSQSSQSASDSMLTHSTSVTLTNTSQALHSTYHGASRPADMPALSFGLSIGADGASSYASANGNGSAGPLLPAPLSMMSGGGGGVGVGNGGASSTASPTSLQSPGSRHSDSQDMVLFGMDLTRQSAAVQFAYLAAGVFIMYFVYGVLQVSRSAAAVQTIARLHTHCGIIAGMLIAILCCAGRMGDAWCVAVLLLWFAGVHIPIAGLQIRMVSDARAVHDLRSDELLSAAH
jgi:hypothetical protein